MEEFNDYFNRHLWRNSTQAIQLFYMKTGNKELAEDLIISSMLSIIHLIFALVGGSIGILIKKLKTKDELK